MSHPLQARRCDGVLPDVHTRRELLKTLTTAGFGYMAFAGLACGGRE